MKLLRKNVLAALAGWTAMMGIAVLSLASCGEKNLGPQEPEEDQVTIEFIVGDPETKVTGITQSNETRINRWALFIFNGSGNLVSSGVVSNGSSSISKTLGQGTYTVWAVCNYPTSGAGQFTPSGVTTLSGLQNTFSYLQNNGTTSLVMAGGESMTFSTNGSRPVPVKRLVSKAGFNRVTVNMSNSAWASQTFILKSAYLTNVYETIRYGMSYSSASELNWNRTRWYNTLGYHGSGSGYYTGSTWTQNTNSSIDALTSDINFNATIASGGASYNTGHYFYFYENPTTQAQDTHRSQGWGQSYYRRTRLVLEATLGGTTYYYVVSLPPSERNNTYIADNVTISRPGSTDPEQEIPGAVDVTWATATDSWDTGHNVSEDFR